MIGERDLRPCEVVAETTRLRLRLKSREDALDDFEWRRDPEGAMYDGALPLAMTFSEFVEHVERDLGFVDPRRRMFAVDTREGLHIGNVMYYNADSARDSAEFGISIGRREWRGHGLGSEAAIAFLRLLWATTPFRRIYLHTLEWNERAQHCFRKAGFEETARVLRDGKSFLRMEARREWWLMWEMEGCFAAVPAEEPSTTAGT